MSDEFANKIERGDEVNPIDRDQGINFVPDGYVLAYDSPDYETGEVVCATLASQGIHAVMYNAMPGPATNTLPPLGNTWSHAVYVPQADAEAARALLSAPTPTEEELAAEQAADPTTLEEAENNVKNA
jgi:hypothetical protein